MQNDSEPRVVISASNFVQPLRPVIAEMVNCSALENICARVHHTFALFFRLESGADVDQIYAHLKHGLSLFLYEHPIICGLLRQDERGAFNVEIFPAPRAGVLFHRGDLTRDCNFPSFEDLQNHGFPFADGDLDGLKELRPDPFPTHADGQPVFTTKVSHVRGGLVWTGSLSHLVADLAQPRSLMIQWAKYTRAVTQALGKEISIPQQLPYPDRKRLTPYDGNRSNSQDSTGFDQVLSSHTLLNPSDPDKMLADVDSIFVKANVPDATSPQRSTMMESSSGLWRFMPADLETLKERVRQHSGNKRLSQFDIVTAFIWQRFHLAKHAGERISKEPRMAQIATALNVRPKLNPPLPAMFLGACVDAVTVKLDDDRLLRSSEIQWNDIAEIASKFKPSRNAWSELEFMDKLRLSMQTKVSPGIAPKGPFEMFVTDHASLADCLTADWGGELGKCVAYREPYIERETPRGELILYPQFPDGSLEIMISAERIVLQRLLADDEMQAACRNVFLRHNLLHSARMLSSGKTKL